MEYIDDYGTCESTFATLRIYPGSMPPDAVTSLLSITPTRALVEGEIVRNGRTRKQINAWLLSSKDILTSRDCRRHIDWILEKLEGKAAALASLRGEGAEIDISCYWASAHGHGGPTISPHQMRRLAELDIAVGWDIYFNNDE